MNQKKFWWILTILMPIMLMACSVGGSSHDQEATKPNTSTPVATTRESGAAMDSRAASAASSASTLNSMLKPGMAYADFRKVVLGQDLTPMVDSQCKTNVVGANHQMLCMNHSDLAACQVCDQVPELSSCSEDGYCLMKFQHAGRGETLEATSYGMIEDWNVSGEDSRLQVSRWAFTGPSGIVHKQVRTNKDAEVIELKPFVDGDTTVLASQHGDLDGKGGRDVVLVLDHPKSGGGQLGEGEHRSLLLLLRNDAGQLRKAGQNDAIVPCAKCGGMAGDPFGYVRVEKGTFMVLVEGGSRERWSNEYVFWYSVEEQGWLLDKVIHGVTDTITGEAEQTELTKKDFGVIRFDEFDPLKLPSVEGT